jgi:hypothetical protein
MPANAQGWSGGERKPNVPFGAVRGGGSEYAHGISWIAKKATHGRHRSLQQKRDALKPEGRPAGRRPGSRALACASRTATANPRTREAGKPRRPAGSTGNRIACANLLHKPAARTRMSRDVSDRPMPGPPSLRSRRHAQTFAILSHAANTEKLRASRPWGEPALEPSHARPLSVRVASVRLRAGGGR